jgi:hypothetical protein
VTDHAVVAFLKGGYGTARGNNVYVGDGLYMCDVEQSGWVIPALR